MVARIFQPARTAMQQGRARTQAWVLEYEPASARRQDPLMGWTSSDDTKGQIRLNFSSQEEAVAYAKRKGIDYVLRARQERVVRPKSYADNFR